MRESTAFVFATGLSLASLLGSLPENAIAASAAHGLNASQIGRIRGMGLKVLVPGYLPAGFKYLQLDEGMTEADENRQTPFYRLVYQGPKNQSFYICGGETCSWGADNTWAQTRKAVKHSLFSRLTLFRYVSENKVSYNTAHEMSLKGGGNYEYGSPENLESGQSALPEAENLKVINGLKLL